MSTEGQVTGNTNLHKQDLSTLDISKLTPTSVEVTSRQATINIGTIGHVAHGKSTVVKAISGVHTVRFKNELERNITIKLERISDEKMLALTSSPQLLREFMRERGIVASVAKVIAQNNNSKKRKFCAISSKLKQTTISSFFSSPPLKKICKTIEQPSDLRPNEIFETVNTPSITCDAERATETQPDRQQSPIVDWKHKQLVIQSGRLRKASPITVCDSPNSDCESSASSIITNLNELNQKAKLLQETTKYKSKAIDEYTVERIDKINEIQGKPHFFVKWKGYPVTSNTWEPLSHMNDCGLLDEFLRRKSKFHQDEIDRITTELTKDVVPMSDVDAFNVLATFDLRAVQSDLILLALLKDNGQNKLKTFDKIEQRTVANLRLLPFYERRVEQQKMLLQFERLINSTDKSSNLTVENLVDFEGPPTGFQYINDVVAGDGVKIPNEPPVYCVCVDGCNSKSQCCSTNNSSKFAYNKQRRICVPMGQPVFECNKGCKCGPECMNRVVQQGRKHSLCIFKTSNGCGWGVRTLRNIYEGQFICEYVGEVINHEEAEHRGKMYDAAGRTYLFDLDMNQADNPYTIDAAHMGNVSHFINHSCDPNCGVWNVWIDCLDIDLPRICLFALRRIEAGEELNFNYNMNKSVEEPQNDVAADAIEKPTAIMCRCQSANCRKFLF